MKLHINIKKLNLSTFSNIKFIEKSYIEGVYINSPLNRKLGRVGMSYSSYNDYIQRKNDGEDVNIEDFKHNDLLEINKAKLKKEFKNVDVYNSSTFSLTNGNKITISKNKKGYIATIIDKYYNVISEFGPSQKENLLINLNAVLYENDLKIGSSITEVGITINDFSDSTKELFAKAKSGKEQTKFIDKLVDNDFSKYEIEKFIGKEFKNDKKKLLEYLNNKSEFNK